MDNLYKDHQLQSVNMDGTRWIYFEQSWLIEIHRPSTNITITILPIEINFSFLMIYIDGGDNKCYDGDENKVCYQGWH